MKKPKKWTELYPRGTEEGSEEQRFFIALARDQKWAYKSTAMLIKETKLSHERVEEIIHKYHKLGLILQSETADNSWAYWERDIQRLKEKKTLVQLDQDERIKKQKKMEN